MTDPLDKPILLTEETWHRAMFPSKERLEESRQWWSKYLHRDISLEETSEIHHNVFGLFKLLFEIDARERAKRAGQPTVDKEKVENLRREILHLEDQIGTTQKMARRWSKGEAQRNALEQASHVLEQELNSKRAEMTKELGVASLPPMSAIEASASADPPPVGPARQRRRAPKGHGRGQG